MTPLPVSLASLFILPEEIMPNTLILMALLNPVAWMSDLVEGL